MNPAIVVTGASSGLGRELARAAAAAGEKACFVLIARSQPALEALAAELAQAGAQAMALPLDVAGRTAGDTIERFLRERDLTCDVVINSAGLNVHGPAAEADRAEQMRLVEVNIRALTELSLRFLPGMVERRRGGVLNLGSIMGYTPGVNMSLYHASKAYVLAFSRALAGEVSGSGAHVMCFAPGVTRTAMVDRLPIRRDPMFKLMPRSNAVETCQAGWSAFRAGRVVYTPRLVDRLVALLFATLPTGAVPHLQGGSGIARQTDVSTRPATVVTGPNSTIVEADGAKHELPLDLAAADAGAAIERALAEHGLHCETLVNCAVPAPDGRATGTGLAAQMRTFDINVSTLTDMTLRLLPGMVARGRGRIVNPIPAGRGAVERGSAAHVRWFNAALAIELKRTGVSVGERI